MQREVGYLLLAPACLNVYLPAQLRMMSVSLPLPMCPFHFFASPFRPPSWGQGPGATRLLFATSGVALALT